MLRIAHCHLAILLVSSVLWAQGVPDPVIHIEVNLVQVDAVVTNSKNQPVTDLAAADFEIRQDGKPQAISNFSYIDTSGRAAGPAVRNPGSQRPGSPLIPTPDLKPADVHRTIAVVVDDLGMSSETIPFVRRAVGKFVDEERQSNDLIAIVPTGGGSGALQQFTTDQRQLDAAVASLRYNSVLSRIGPTSLVPSGTPINTLITEISRRETFKMLDSVLRSLQSLPGRKVLLLFSEDLQMLQENPRLADQANRASAVIYTIDPRGLPTLSLTASDNVRTSSPQTLAQVVRRKSADYLRSQAGMAYLAYQTGGLFFHDDNDIDGTVRKVGDDSSGYYLIGYHPDSATFGAKTQQAVFHKLEVSLKRNGLHVRSRAGFFGRPDPERDLARVHYRPRTRQGQIDAALSSPFASDSIHLGLTTLFSATQEGPGIDVLLHIDTRDLRFSQEPDGIRKATVEAVSMLSAAREEKPDFRSDTLTLRFDAKTYDAVLHNGLRYSIHRPIAAPGPYQFKVVLRDNSSEEIGSASQFVEVPDLHKDRLTLSGIMMNGGKVVPAVTAAAHADPDTVTSPAVRAFPPASPVILHYQIFNARANAKGQPDLLLEMRLFRDGQQVYASSPAPFDATGQTHTKELMAATPFALAASLAPGNYVLQVLLTDRLAPKKEATASQYIDFEIRP